MLPVVGFGISYYFYGLHTATICLTALSGLFVATAYAMGEKLGKLQWGTFICLVILGTLTLVFQDEQFIKWKTTIINGSLALVFLLSHLSPKTISERLIGDIGKINAPDFMLRRVNVFAVMYFATVAGLNLVFAYYFDTTTWVNFKLFGVFALNVLFIGFCAAYLWEYIKDHVERMS